MLLVLFPKLRLLLDTFFIGVSTSHQREFIIGDRYEGGCSYTWSFWICSQNFPFFLKLEPWTIISIYNQTAVFLTNSNCTGWYSSVRSVWRSFGSGRESGPPHSAKGGINIVISKPQNSLTIRRSWWTKPWPNFKELWMKNNSARIAKVDHIWIWRWGRDN